MTIRDRGICNERKEEQKTFRSYFYFPVGCYSNDCITLVFGENRIYLPVFWIVILACAAAFLGWWVYMSVRINHLIKRLDAAGFQYQTTHDEKAYLTELDECAKMPGAEKITLSKMPAKDYLTILKIRTLREAGRTAEASTLLETARPEITNDRARQLLKAEEEQLP